MYRNGFLTFALAVLVGGGCSSPSSTSLNRVAPDAAGAKSLTFISTTSALTFTPEATVQYRDGTSSFFPRNVLITCNGTILIDTRTGRRQGDTSFFIASNAGSFDWRYTGPDTTFEITMEGGSMFNLLRPFTDEALSLHKPFIVQYSPAVDFDSAWLTAQDLRSSFTVPVALDTIEGTIALTKPINPPQGLMSSSGEVTLGLARIRRFTTDAIHSVIVMDQVIGQQTPVIWQ